MERSNIKSHDQQSVPVMLVLQPPANDAINMVDLWRALLIRKWIVFTALAVSLLVSVIYALQAVPVFRVEAHLLPPQASDVEQLQSMKNIDVLGMQNVTPQSAYALFVQNLRSLSLRKRFFDARIAAGQPGARHDAAALTRAFDGFNKALSVVRDKKHVGRIRVLFDGPDPRRDASLVNAIIVMANRETVKMLLNEAEGALENQRKLLRDTIKAKRSLALQRKDDKLVQLREAISVAKKADIKVPSKIWASMNKAPLYLLGYKALRAQEHALQRRKNEDAFIPHLRSLQEKLSLLNDIKFNPSQISAVTIDQLAQIPDHRIKPRRKLIVLLGLVIGLAVGLFLAILLEFISRASRA